MQLTTLIGLILAAVGLLGGMYFKHVPFSALANPAAIFIILIGTSGAVMNAMPGSTMKNIGKLFKIIFFGNKLPYTNAEVITLLTDLAQLARREGMLVLETKIEEINDPFLRRGIIMLSMGQNSEGVEASLSEDIEAMELRHQSNAGIFSQAGTYAPTLGVLGAVIGLIAALGNMQDMDALGAAISAAFMATVYGIFTGYVLWHPFGNKLKMLSKEEALNKRIMVEGILLIYEGITPNMIKEKLLSFMSSAERVKYFPDEKN